MANPLQVSGMEIPLSGEEAGFLTSRFHTVERELAVAVQAQRDGGSAITIPEAQPGDLVELRLADDSVVVTTFGRLQEWIAPSVKERGLPSGRIPELVYLGEPDRGAAAVVIKMLRWLKVSPVEEIAALSVREAVRVIERQSGRPQGLYALSERGELSGSAITQPLVGTAPLLLFLHGTASSTGGSFGGLFADTAEWRELRRAYGERIFALEHHTLSASPAENTLELARLLPDKAEIHLVSHSRGGLIGELLCRGGFGSGDLKVFHRDGKVDQRAEELAVLTELGRLLGEKQLRIERFVRVACPAAGTVLASNRLDLYLSVLLNAIKIALPVVAGPALDLLSAVLLEVARRRTEPSELPGLEAQRPESPFIHFLNRPDVEVDQDLAVIAGDLKAGNVLQTLRTVAGYAFFLQKNDLVVHTRAMYGGLRRKGQEGQGGKEGGWVSFHEGPKVTHFSYFKEAVSRQQLAAALLRPTRQTPPRGFKPLVEDKATRSFAFWREAPRQALGSVLFLPDLLASGLRAAGESIWPSVEALAAGKLGTLAADQLGVGVGGVVGAESFAPLTEALAAERRELRPLPYDWRGGVEEAARALRVGLSGAPAPRPTAVLAHGLGALGVLRLVAAGDPAWLSFVKEGGRAVLAAPPLLGAQEILRLAVGRGRLFGLLTRLDESRSPTEVLRLFLGLQGVADLLPEEALRREWWEEAGLTVPRPPRPLAEIAAERQRLAAASRDAALCFVLGAARDTPTLSLDSEGELKSEVRGDGDGWMLNPEKQLPLDSFWQLPVLHERLPWDRTSVPVLVDLLLRGDTARASSSPPEKRPERPAAPVLFPTQEDLDAVLLAQSAGEAATEWVLRVRVAHGSLDRLGMPVAIGHYEGVGLVGSEKFVDQCLAGALSRRLELNDYPGPPGSAAFVAAPASHPPGALVVGLGDPGGLNAATLSRGIERGVLVRALDEIDRRLESGQGGDPPTALPLASLLIGTRGGSQLSVRQAIAAVARGVIQAHRALVNAKLDQQVDLSDLVFVELWGDIAIEAGHALTYLPDDATLGLIAGERVEPETRLLTLDGGRGNAPSYAGSWSWWRRLIVTEEVADAGLRFVSLTEKARAEERLLSAHRRLVDELLQQASKSISDEAEGSVVNALFELLLPVALKESLFEGEDLVLVVDRGAGRYPWELLARRRGDRVEPLIERVKIVRQFRTREFRDVVVPARTDQALVIGDPADTGLPVLDAAHEEGKEVVNALDAGGFVVESALRLKGRATLQKIFLRDYRILHIAAHGEFNPGRPEESGVVLGRGDDGGRTIFSAAAFEQLRAVPEVVFLNCCHLGRLDAPVLPAGTVGNDAERARLAVSVAEALIRIGVRAVVVAGWAVNDAAARRFASEFYRRLLAGETFGEAVHAARIKVWREFRHTTTWGAYQCYGDPAFRLRRGGGDSWEAGPRHFVSVQEMREHLADLVQDARTLRGSAEARQAAEAKLAARLQAVEAVLEREPAWKADGQVLTSLGEAWGELDSQSAAITYYRRALEAWDSRTPLRAAEQLASLLDRCEVSAGESLEHRAEVERWLAWSEVAGPSPQRCSLRGGMLKRRGMAAKGDERRELFAEAAKHYRRAVEMSLERTGLIDYAPALNTLALLWAAGQSMKSDELQLWLAGSRESAAQSRQRSGDRLWNVLADAEADLLEALLTNTLTRERVGTMRDHFRRTLATLGSAREHGTAMGQLAFLLQCAEQKEMEEKERKQEEQQKQQESPVYQPFDLSDGPAAPQVEKKKSTSPPKGRAARELAALQVIAEAFSNT